MITPVHDEGRWWAGGQRLTAEELVPLLASLEVQVRGHFPQATEVYRSFLACFPRHALLRFTVPSEHGLRTSFAFYAGGQLYPIDWTGNTLVEFAEVALELRTVEQAADFVRFVTSAALTGGSRFFVVEDLEELRLRPGVWFDHEESAALNRVIHPLEPVPARGHEEVFRFRCTLLHDGTLFPCTLAMDAAGHMTSEPDPDHGTMDVPVVADRVESDEYFVLVREASLTAERFLRRMRTGPINQVRVIEPVRLRGEVFSEAVFLSQVTFEEGADFTGARFDKGLTLERCVVEGRLDLRDAYVRGPLHAPGLRFHREGGRRDDAALEKATRYGTLRVDLDASGLRVEGSCFFEGIRTANAVDLSRSKIDGDLRFGGADIGRRRSAEPTERPESTYILRLDAADIGGDLDLAWVRDRNSSALETDPADRALDHRISGYSSPLAIVRGGIQAKGVVVGGDVAMPALRCEGDVWLSGARIGGSFVGEATATGRRTVILGTLWLDTADVGGYVGVSGMFAGEGIQLFSSRAGSFLVARTDRGDWGRVPPLCVRGRMDLSGCKIPDVELAGAEIGELRIVTGEFGRLRVTPGVEEVPADEAGGHDLRRSLRLRPTRIGKVDLWDLTVRKRLVLRADIAQDLNLGNIDCAGDLEFWNDQVTDASLNQELGSDERWHDGRPRPRFEERTRIGGHLRCTGLEIGGRLVLTNLCVDGRILFKNCQIRQDLNCSATGPDPSSASGRTRTTCRHLDLELTGCGGDVDLAGLDVVERGSLHARQLDVSGRILFARAVGKGGDESIDAPGGIPSDHDVRVQASIAGDVDLSVARAGQLVLTGSSVAGRINLERGVFRRLDVIEAWLLAGHDLSDVGVDRWEIPDEHLVTFLDRSQPFARATYVAIEKMLRNKAQDADADRVYRAMRARAIREVRSGGRSTGLRAADGKRESWWTRAAGPASYLLSTAGSRMQGWLYGWGTLYWVPLVVFSLLTVPLTWWILATGENVTPSLELLATADVPAEGAAPADVGLAWGPSDGFWLTVRYHVPVIPLAAREEFRPAPRGAVLRLPGPGTFRLPFTTEGYAFAVYLLNWMLWPLFLVGLGRRIVRETT